MKIVGVVGDMPKGCEGTDVVEVGRSRRELREPQGEGDIVHVEQGRTVARSKRKQPCRWSLTTSVEVRCMKKKNGTTWMRSGEIEDATIAE